MRIKAIIWLLIWAALLASGAPPAAAQETAGEPVVKRACLSAIGYTDLETLKEDLLLRAKREAANELFGELIAASTTVDNLMVTDDQIRLQSMGLIRLQGDVRYANGSYLAEVCASITAYATVEDRAQFQPLKVSNRQCVADPNLTVREVRTRAEEAAKLQALVDYDSRLGGYDAETILPLLRRVEYAESGFVSGTESYCVKVEGDVTPIEVLSFLSLDGEMAVLGDAPAATAIAATPGGSGTPTPTRTPASKGGATLAPAEATAAAFTATREAFEKRTPTPTPTATPTPDSTATAVSLMIDVLATAEAAPHHVADLRVNPVDDAVYVYVPEGEFTMGSGDGEEHEQPVHRVYLDAFWIMRTEVTNAQYDRCVRAGVCTAPENDMWRDVRYADHPVTDVDWNQASTYAEWAGGRLPTEAEWEKACRGGDLRAYPWGNAEPDAALLNFDGSGVGETTAAGSYPGGASPYGALDMAGNVWEWTADWYSGGYYADSPEENPTGPESGTSRRLRGGSFYINAYFVRCAYRDGLDPDFRDYDLGFRVLSPGF